MAGRSRRVAFTRNFMNMRLGKRGFANPEYLIVLTILCVLAAIIVPNVVRAVQRRKDATLIGDVYRVRDHEDAYFRAHHQYAGILALEIADTISAGHSLDHWLTDSSGWGVIVLDSARHRRCGMFDGGDLYRPSGQVSRPREIACW